MSSITQDIVILNDFGGSTVERRSRTTSSGTKDRFTMTIKAEPVLLNFNKLRLGEKPAQAIRDLIVRQIKAVGSFASPATQKRRERAKDALARGAEWAKRRYSGGRIGRMEPDQTQRDFNDSGRLTQIDVRENLAEQSWTINFPKNRLTPIVDGVREFTEQAWNEFVQDLVRSVPALRGGNEILRDETVRRAIATAAADAITVIKQDAQNRSRQATARLAGTIYRQLLKPLVLG